MDFFTKLMAGKSWALLALRLAVGGIFVFHGIQKLQMWGTLSPLFKFLAIAEPLGGIALIFGFLTQLAALGLAIIMIGAIYTKQFVWNVGFSANNATGWEFDLVLLAGCVVLFFIGAGAIALDRYVIKTR